MTPRQASDPDAVADRIIDVLHRSFSIDGHEVFVGVSVGIATGREDAETLLRNADEEAGAVTPRGCSRASSGSGAISG